MLAGSGVRAARHRGRDRADPPRALRRRRLPARAGGRGDPDRGPDRRRRGRVRRAHHRPHLPPAGSIEKAVETLRAERGRQFDPARRGRLPGRDRRGRSRSATASRPPPEERPATAARGQADHAAGRRGDARDLAQPPAPLGRRGPDPERPHRRRAPPLLAGRRAPARGRERRAPARSGRSSRPASRSRCWPRACARTAARSRPRRPRRSTAKARPAGSRPRPPPTELATGSSELGAAARPASTRARCRPRRADAGAPTCHAASLLERHAFLERFGQVVRAHAGAAGAEREEIAGTRRLFASLQQGLLERATEASTISD